MPTKKKDEKYDNTRYVDWAIEVTKPAKPLKKKTTTKKGTNNGKRK